MPEAENTRQTIGAVDTVFDVIEYLHETDGAGVTELATELEVAKSTAHRHLTTLLERGYVVRDGEQYHTGLRFLDLGESARNRLTAYSLIEPKVEELAEITNERVQFLVEEHGEAVYVMRKSGKNAIQTDPGLGKTVPLHGTSAGKAMLAHMAPEKRDRIIEEVGLAAITDETITDRDELESQLANIRERGYGVNDQENLKGLRAIGVQIQGPDGEVIGALSVSGPIHRLKGDRFHSEIPDLLLGVANELELNLAHSLSQ